MSPSNFINYLFAAPEIISLRSAYPPAPLVRRNLHMRESGTGQQRRQAGSGTIYTYSPQTRPPRLSQLQAGDGGQGGTENTEHKS